MVLGVLTLVDLECLCLRRFLDRDLRTDDRRDNARQHKRNRKELHLKDDSIDCSTRASMTVWALTDAIE